MGFFREIGNALTRFMYGRNGTDSLNQALIWLYLGLWLAEVVCASLLRLELAARMINAVNFLLIIYILFRMFSKNLPKRRAENQKWLTWRRVRRNRQTGARERRADKEHRYFTCKSCGTICRVPAGKGRIEITCPKCGAKIQAKT